MMNKPYYMMASMKFFHNMNQNVHVFCDVAALGDCAIIAILGNPSCKVPLTSVQKLWCAVVFLHKELPLKTAAEFIQC
jgi:hypothetical protein